MERFVVPIMLICSMRLAGRPALTNARSSTRLLAPRTHSGEVGFEFGKRESQILRICGLMFCTRDSWRPSVWT
jgi:hypothetical protein